MYSEDVLFLLQRFYHLYRTNLVEGTLFIQRKKKKKKMKKNTGGMGDQRRLTSVPPAPLKLSQNKDLKSDLSVRLYAMGINSGQVRGLFDS